jgi:prepilin-type N-terminal cleavage/methylation domain-containing protein
MMIDIARFFRRGPGRPVRRSLGEGGFTLIEILIALAVLSLLLTAIYRIFLSEEKFFRDQELATAMQEDLRSLSEFFNQEMSWAGYKVTGIAVQYAASNMVIWSGAIPGLSSTSTAVSYIAYYYDAANRRLYRGVSPTLAGVQLPLNANHRVLADNVDSMTISYYDFAGGMFSVGTPLVLGVNNNPLRGIQRVRASVTIRAPRPDSSYTSPLGDHYYRRSGVIDVKLRNVEDVSISGTSVGTGGCGYFDMTVSPLTYAACADTPTGSISGNPRVHIKVNTGAGAPNNVTPVYVLATGGYQFVSATDPGTLINVLSSRVAGSGDIYLMWGAGSTGAAGEDVDIVARFTPSEAGCVELSRTARVTITAGLPSQFDTTGPYSPGGVQAEIIDLSTSLGIGGATEVKVCPATDRMGARLKVRVVDECGNGIAGQTVTFTAVDSGGNPMGTFASGTIDGGDGIYSVVWRPPDAISGASDTAIITATWSGLTVGTTLPLVPGAPRSVEVVDITGLTDLSGNPLYQFAHPSANAFRIERLTNVPVTVVFQVKDGCGNRVYGALSRLSVATSYGSTTAVTALPDGTYTFTWSSPWGCGAGIPGQTISVSDAGIIPAAPLAVGFDLLTTSNVAQLVLTISDPLGLTPGCTGDERALTAVIQQYNSIADRCENVPGPFPVTFTVTGADPLKGNGSFSNSNLTLTTFTATAADDGIATARLYPGTCRLGQSLQVSATADVEGAATGQYSLATLVATRATGPGGESGFYRSGYLVRAGTSYPPENAYDPGQKIYLQIQDCDENEDPFAVDSLNAPYLTVQLVSSAAGVVRDIETVKLTETGVNTAMFKPNTSLYGTDAGIATELADAGVNEDGRLQVRHGDLITLTYNDSDLGTVIPSTWTAWVAGARSLTLYKRSGPSTWDTIIVGGAQVQTMRADPTEEYAPVLYFPQYDGDGSPDTTTVSISGGTAAGETDIFTMKERGDTGYFWPSLGSRDYVVISQGPTDTGYAPEGWLQIPFTPVAVTVRYPPASPYLTGSFTVSDSDPPSVAVTGPGDGSTVSGIVPITVDAFDLNNAIDPGIDRIELYVDGRLFGTLVAPPDLSGTSTFTWTTASGGLPRWLDGQHRIWAKAWDKAGNVAQSSIVTVTVANGLSALWFDAPAASSIWSDLVTVTFRTSIDTSLGSYTASLIIGGDGYAPTPIGSPPTAWQYDWHTRPSFSDGTYVLYATLKDNEANSTYTAMLPVVVDHTPPAIGLPSPSYPWLGDYFPYSGTFTVSDANGVMGTSITAVVTGACPETLAITPMGGDLYQYTYTGPCAATVGSIGFTVTARDTADTPNTATATVRASIDTVHPSLAPITATPIYGPSFRAFGRTFAGFLKGTSSLRSAVVDDYPLLAGWGFYYLGLPAKGLPAWGGSVAPVALDSYSTGAFHYTWNTAGYLTSSRPWTQGPYLVGTGGLDRALNFQTANALEWFYLDNQPPSLTNQIWPWIINVNFGSNNLSFRTDAMFGYLSSIGERVYAGGASPVFSSILDYPTVSAETATWQHTWNGSPLASGAYQVRYFARDHAGNRTETTPYSFNICRHQISAFACSFEPQGGYYDARVTGTVTNLATGAPAANMELWIGYYRVGPGSPTGYQGYSDHVFTDAAGHYDILSDTSAARFYSGENWYMDHFTTQPGCSSSYMFYRYVTVP